jgi:hypothetical protein
MTAILFIARPSARPRDDGAVLEVVAMRIVDRKGRAMPLEVMRKV